MLVLFAQGVSVQGVYVLEAKCRGVSVQGVSVWGVLCPWGKCPGGTCPGGLCPRTIDEYLNNKKKYASRNCSKKTVYLRYFLLVDEQIAL